MGDENIEELLRRRDKLLEDREMDELLRRRDSLLINREKPQPAFFMDTLDRTALGFGVWQFTDNFSKTGEKWESLAASSSGVKLGGLVQLVRNAKYMAFVKESDKHWTQMLLSYVGAVSTFEMRIMSNKAVKTDLILTLYEIKILNVIPNLGSVPGYSGYDMVEIKFEGNNL
jgi:hypothetical protein